MSGSEKIFGEHIRHLLLFNKKIPRCGHERKKKWMRNVQEKCAARAIFF